MSKASAPQTRFVLAAHGTHSPPARAAVRALTDAVRARTSSTHRDTRHGSELDIEAGVDFADAFVDVQPPTPDEVVRTLARRRGAALDGSHITIVPVLLSTGYHVRVDLRRAAGQAEGVRVARPLGPDARLAAVSARRLEESGLRRGDGHVVTLADAGSRDLASQRDVGAAAAGLARRLGRGVSVSHATAADPRTTDLVREHADRGQQVAVASYLLAPGHFAGKLAASGAALVSAPLLPEAAADDPAAVPDELVDVVLDRCGLLAVGANPPAISA